MPLPNPDLLSDDLPTRLRADVEAIAGERHFNKPERLVETAAWITERLTSMGLMVNRHPFELEGRPFVNLEAVLPGRTTPEDIVVVGAHYDTVWSTPGANDNGSGVASMLAFAHALAQTPTASTIRIVAFVNEEPPFFQSEGMGSWQYAMACKERGDGIVGMISLETMGYYDQRPGSQNFPDPAMAQVFPSTGNFLALVGNPASAGVLKVAEAGFRAVSDFPLQAAALPPHVMGVGWSDQWSFWQAGYPGLMATDTAPFRYPWYHEPGDTPEKLDYEGLAGATVGLFGAIVAMAGGVC